VGWARAQSRAYRKLAPRRHHPIRVIAIVNPCAEAQPELGFHLPKVAFIDGSRGFAVGSDALMQLSELLGL
jgi:hypothetical protein